MLNEIITGVSNEGCILMNKKDSYIMIWCSMPAIEKAYWIVSAVCITVMLFGWRALQGNVYLIVLGIQSGSLIICRMVLDEISRIGSLLHIIYDNKVPVFMWDRWSLIDELESGRFNIPPRQMQYIRSVKRVWNYGFIPVLVVILLGFSSMEY